jgi:hypothetical protein
MIPVNVHGSWVQFDFAPMQPDEIAAERLQIVDISGTLDEICLWTLFNVALVLGSKDEKEAGAARGRQARREGVWFAFASKFIAEKAAAFDPFKLWILWLAALTLSEHDVMERMPEAEEEDE